VAIGKIVAMAAQIPTAKRYSKGYYLWLVTVITLLAFGARLYRLDAHSLRGDEAASATYASLSPAEILEISRVADPHPPLFYLVLHHWEKVAGPSEFAVRFWVLLPGVLLVPSLYALAWRLIDHHVASVAATLMAINSFHIWHSQDVRSYTWFTLLGLWATLFMWLSLRRGRWFDWGRYALTVAILFYLHYYALFVVAFHGLYLLWFLGRVRPRSIWPGLKWGGSLLLAGLVFIPWLRVSWHFITRFSGDFEPATPQTVLWRGLQAFSGGLVAGGRSQFSVWIIPFALLAGLGLWALWRSRRAAAIFTLLYLALPFLGIMALTLRGQAFTERYLIAALPAYIILLAAGLGWPGLRPTGLGIGLIAAVGLSGYALSRYHFDPDLAKSPEWDQVFDYIAQEQNTATDVVIYNFPEAAVTYYLDTKRPEAAGPVFLVPGGPNPPPPALDQYLSNLLLSYRRVWFVPVNAGGWDDAQQVARWLERHGDRLKQVDFHWIRTELYLTPAGIERSMHPQPVVFASGVTLRGFQVFNTISEMHENVSLSGEPLNLSLYWTAAGPTEIPLTVFSQLIDATGFFRGGQDNQPVWGTYPTTAWRPGEKITDKYQLQPQPDAPAGEYQVWVGLYDLQTGERVMILDPAGNPVADHVVLDLKVIVE